MDYIHINGQLLRYDDARIAPADAGFLHGAGLFETMRARNGRIFRLADHLRRLADSAQVLGMELALTSDQVQGMADDLLAANDLHTADARLRLTITRGDAHEITPESPTPPITLVLSAAPFGAYPAELYQTGMSVIISSYRQNPRNPLTGHKTTSYLDRLMALREAHLAKGGGAGEALWFTPDNETVAEGCISNVFIVDANGNLVTPPLTFPLTSPVTLPPASPAPPPPSVLSPQSSPLRLCLPGITRQLVLSLAVDAHILPHERLITIADLLAAKEVFLTNAVMGVMPVTHIEKHAIADEKPGALTRVIAQRYQVLLEEECHG